MRGSNQSSKIIGHRCRIRFGSGLIFRRGWQRFPGASGGLLVYWPHGTRQRKLPDRAPFPRLEFPSYGVSFTIPGSGFIVSLRQRQDLRRPLDIQPTGPFSHCLKESFARVLSIPVDRAHRASRADMRPSAVIVLVLWRRRKESSVPFFPAIADPGSSLADTNCTALNEASPDAGPGLRATIRRGQATRSFPPLERET